MSEKIDFDTLAQDFISHVNTTAASLLLKIEVDPEFGDRKLGEGEVATTEGKKLPTPISGSNSQINYLGVEEVRYVDTKDGFRGLGKEAYAELTKLVHQIISKKTFFNLLSEKITKDIFFSWLRKCYNGEIVVTDNFYAYFKLEVEKEVREREVLIAISYLTTSQPLKIGDVTIVGLDNNFFESLKKTVLSLQEVDSKKITEERLAAVRSLHNKYHTVAFAKTKLYADQEKAEEIARDRTSKALEILRLFSPTAHFPEIPSYFDIAGKDDLKISNIIFIEDDGLPIESSGFDEQRRHEFVLRAEFHKLLSATPLLNHLNIIATKQKKTELEVLIQDSISLFSQNVKSHDFHIKLVFLLVILESIFLETPSEPIQVNVGMRLVFLLYPQSTSQEFARRNQIFNFFKSVYESRSNFLHHGKVVVSLESIRELQNLVFLTIETIVNNLGKWKTKSEMIRSIKTRVFM